MECSSVFRGKSETFTRHTISHCGCHHTEPVRSPAVCVWQKKDKYTHFREIYRHDSTRAESEEKTWLEYIRVHMEWCVLCWLRTIRGLYCLYFFTLFLYSLFVAVPQYCYSHQQRICRGIHSLHTINVCFSFLSFSAGHNYLAYVLLALVIWLYTYISVVVGVVVLHNLHNFLFFSLSFSRSLCHTIVHGKINSWHAAYRDSGIFLHCTMSNSSVLKFVFVCVRSASSEWTAPLRGANESKL